jgi:hypothetical protein
MTFLANIARRDSDPKVLRSGSTSLAPSDRLGKALGWFSLGLGLVELFAPRQITRALGMEGQEALVRSYGVREISSGMLSLSTEKTLGLWSRVGGDAIDIATLTTALRNDNPKKSNVAAAIMMVGGITLLDLGAAQATTRRHMPNGHAKRQIAKRHIAKGAIAKSGDRNKYRDRSGFPKGIESVRRAA